MPARNRPAELVELVLYEDPLSPWCLVAERRIATVLEEFSGTFAPPVHLPLPFRVEPRALSQRERSRFARWTREAAREPEGRGIRPDLWLSPDAPLSTIPVAAALEAARLQGGGREAALRTAVREAAFFGGVNVARRDVLIELAERAGLDLVRFAGALAAPTTEQRVREALEGALDRGIAAAPALVVGDEWLVVGPRSEDEYRGILRRYAIVKLGLAPGRTLH